MRRRGRYHPRLLCAENGKLEGGRWQRTMVTWPDVDPSIWLAVVRTRGIRWPWGSEEGDGDHGISQPQVGGGSTWQWLSWSSDAHVADPPPALASSSLSSPPSPWSLFSWDWINDRKGGAVGVRATSRPSSLDSTSPSTSSSSSSSLSSWSLLSWDRITDWKREAIGTGAVSQPASPARPARGHVSRRETGGGGSSGLLVSPKLRGVCAGCEFHYGGGDYESTPFVPFLPYIPYTQKLPWHTGPRAVACRLFPKYGNYCGPNWSSGRDCGALHWDKGPVDWLDHCCLVHDIGYDSHSQVDLYKADCQLLVCLQSPPRGRDGKPFRLSPWGEFYRAFCIRGLETVILPYRQALIRLQESQRERRDDRDREMDGLQGKLVLAAQCTGQTPVEDSFLSLVWTRIIHGKQPARKPSV